MSEWQGFDWDKPASDSTDFVSSSGNIFTEGKSGSNNASPFGGGFSSNASYDNEGFDEVVEMIMPSTRPKQVQQEKPQIVVIDDDYATLDLMKIYLQRSYDYKAFDNPREAIFYLNKNVPSMIFLDFYISIISSKRLIEILHSYPEFDNVPIYLLAEPDEKGAIMSKIGKEGITGIGGLITRPVARGDLQAALDAVFPKE